MQHYKALSDLNKQIAWFEEMLSDAMPDTTLQWVNFAADARAILKSLYRLRVVEELLLTPAEIDIAVAAWDIERKGKDA